MAGVRLDPGDLNICIKDFIEEAVKNKKIELVKEGNLFPEKDYKRALHYFVFKRVIQEVEAKAVTGNFIFAYTVKDSSTPENTPSLYSLEDTLPALKQLAEQNQAVLYMPLALCRNIAKINLSLTQVHHMVLLELNASNKSLQVYDPEGVLFESFQETLRTVFVRVGFMFYPDKVSNLKDQYKYLGWNMLGIQKHSQQCVRYVAASLESILQTGSTIGLSQIKLVIKVGQVQASIDMTGESEEFEESEEEFREAVKAEQKKVPYGAASPRKFKADQPSLLSPQAQSTPSHQKLRKQTC